MGEGAVFTVEVVLQAAGSTAEGAVFTVEAALEVAGFTAGVEDFAAVASAAADLEATAVATEGIAERTDVPTHPRWAEADMDAATDAQDSEVTTVAGLMAVAPDTGLGVMAQAGQADEREALGPRTPDSAPRVPEAIRR